MSAISYEAKLKNQSLSTFFSNDEESDEE